MPKPLVLVVVDDVRTRAQIRGFLEPEFCVQEARDSAACLRALEEHSPDLLVLDALTPKFDGWQIFRRIRSTPGIPVIVLRPRGRVPDWAMGLPLCADDYVTTPIRPRELVDCAKSLLEQPAPIISEHPIITSGDLVMDIVEQKAVWQGRTLALTPEEFDLLALLVAHEGQPQGREQIFPQVWGAHSGEKVEVVDRSVRRLRLALGDGAGMITAVWGKGYQFTPVRALEKACK